MVELMFSLVHAFVQTFTFPKIVGILDVFRETYRYMMQYWVVFLPLPSLGVAKNVVQIWSN